MLKYQRALDCEDITALLWCKVITIVHLTFHPATSITDLKYTQSLAFQFLQHAKMTAQLGAMRSEGLGGSGPGLEEKGQGETEFVPIPKGRTRSKSIVPLPPTLEDEFQCLKESFTVTTGMLKEIVDQFEKELAEGLEKDFQNIVGYNAKAAHQLT